jgi:hypothetical protein
VLTLVQCSDLDEGKMQSVVKGFDVYFEETEAFEGIEGCSTF